MTAEISVENCKILITAQEAFSAFEEVVLNAQSDIVAGFRLFDFTTRLHTDAARRVGETWFDLVLHKVDQGVRFDLTVSDFDPIVRTKLHGKAWRSVRAGAVIAQASRHPDRISVRADMHSARVGSLSCLALWPQSRGLLADTVARLDKMEQENREKFLRDHPGLQKLLVMDRVSPPRARMWPPQSLVPTTHHHKLAIIDRKAVYIGGLDLNDRRYDTPEHDQEAEQTWHDVQLMIHDAALAEQALTHLGAFDGAAEGEKRCPERPFLSTRSVWQGKTLLSMQPDTVEDGLRQAHLEQIAASRDLIYLETQFLRDREITAALATAASKWPDLSLVLILPGAPDDVAFEGADSLDARFGEFLQAECVTELSKAFGERAFFGSPVKPKRTKRHDRGSLHQSPLIYVHAKVSIFDDRAAIVSSANLNGRSLSWDTEAGVELTNPDLVKELKRRCVAHWLAGGDPAPFLSGSEAIRAWTTLGLENAAASPEDRQGFLVPYDVAPARELGTNLPGIPEQMV